MERDLTSPGGKILITLYNLNKEITVTQLVKIFQKSSSASTVTNWLYELEKLGLVQIREERTTVGTTKKLISLTNRGRLAAEYLKSMYEIIEVKQQ